MVHGIARSTGTFSDMRDALIEAGSVTPLIDRVFPLEEIAEAFSYYKAGHMQGKVIIQVIEED